MPLILIDNGERRFIPHDKPVFKTPGILGLENEKIKGKDRSEPQEQQSFAAHLAQKKYEQTQNQSHEHQKIIYASEIMSSPVTTLAPSTTFAQAWHLIQNHRFRYIPIVNPDGSPIGIVSDRNLLKSAMTLGWNIFQEKEAVSLEQTIGKHFTLPVIAGLPRTEVRSIAKALFENHIGAMPIVNDDNAVIGIITRSDILRALMYMRPIEIWG